MESPRHINKRVVLRPALTNLAEMTLESFSIFGVLIGVIVVAGVFLCLLFGLTILSSIMLAILAPAEPQPKPSDTGPPELKGGIENAMNGQVTVLQLESSVTGLAEAKDDIGPATNEQDKLAEAESKVRFSSRPTEASHASSTIAAFDSNHASPFFKLPGELRNKIYRYALLRDDGVQITTQGYERSALLRICRQVRGEAFGIFYYENRFRIVTVDYNSDALHAWDRHKNYGLFGSKISCESKAGVNSVPNWTNLLTWMQRVHAKECNIVPALPRTVKGQHGHHRPEVFVLGGISSIVGGMINQPWSRVASVLGEHRLILARLDPRWGQN